VLLVLDAECWVLLGAAGCWVLLGAWCWVLSAGADAGCWLLL